MPTTLTPFSRGNRGSRKVNFTGEAALTLAPPGQSTYCCSFCSCMKTTASAWNRFNSPHLPWFGSLKGASRGRFTGSWIVADDQQVLALFSFTSQERSSQHENQPKCATIVTAFACFCPTSQRAFKLGWQPSGWVWGLAEPGSQGPPQSARTLSCTNGFA